MSHTPNDRLLVQILLLGLLGATLWVLAPFMSALFWAAMLAFATWPAMTWLSARLRGREATAAGLLMAGWMLLLVAPLAWFASNAADYIRAAIGLVGTIRSDGLPEAPAWLGQTPLIGPRLLDWWQRADELGAGVFRALSPYFGEAGNFLLARSAQLGRGLLELLLSLVLLFFFYRHGARMAALAQAMLERLIGERAEHYLGVIASTVQRVVAGLMGAAVAQAVVALVGFLIAGVPGAAVLAILTFFLSIIPGGPPLVWIPVTVWLFWQGHPGYGVFMGLWGLLAISSVDNVLRPYLISRGGSLPLIVVLLGVFGGLLAFGFMGLFIGPTLLALAWALISDWIRIQPTKGEE